MGYTKKIIVFASITLFTLLSPVADKSLSADFMHSGTITMKSMQLSDSSMLIDPFKSVDHYLSSEKKSSFDFSSIAASWAENSRDGSRIELQIQFKVDNKWGDWIDLEEEIEAEKGDTKLKYAMASTNPAQSFRYKFTMYSDGSFSPSISNLKWTFINAAEPRQNSSSKLLTSSSSTTNTFDIINRRSWGANESLRYMSASSQGKEPDLVELGDDFYTKFAYELKLSKVIKTDSSGRQYIWPLQYPTKIRKIIVHHTATNSSLDNPAQAIRDIYYYHAVSRGWGDIGYNYIIDQNGKIYEGRYGGEGVIGAHAGSGNNGSIGIAVLGNYEDSIVPSKVLNSLEDLIAQKSKIHNLDPTGSSSFRGKIMPNIIGHKDIMATTCPGRNLYSALAIIRKTSKSKISNIGTSKQLYVNDYDYEYMSDIFSIDLENKQSKNITLELKNTGKITWNKDTFIVVDQNPAFAGLLSFPTKSGVKLATMQESSVKSGQTATFKFTVSALDKADTVYMNIAPIINDKKKISNYTILPVTVRSQSYKYELVNQKGLPAIAKKGQKLSAWVELKNTGTATWYASGNNSTKLGTDHPRDSLSQFNGLKEATRIANMEPDIVRPGEIAKFIIEFNAPNSPGHYKQYFSPVVEGKTWMQDTGLFVETTVEGTVESYNDDDIRVKIGFEGSPIIKANGYFDIYAGGRFVAGLSPTESVQITKVGSNFRIKTSKQSFLKSGPIRLMPVSGAILKIDNFEHRPEWNPNLNDNEYRGILEIANVNNILTVINELSLEHYLRGLGEVRDADPTEKIKTIMVAARTYALYYMGDIRKFPGKPYDLDDDPEASQRYLGYGFEKRAPHITAAVIATQGEVVTYKGKLVKTPYFNQSDGVKTKSAKEKWGWDDTPYLISVDDSYCKSSGEFLGHGVGLSGCGAVEMARLGFNYQSILKYYYTGIEISKI